jgi:hypothetical protein
MAKWINLEVGNLETQMERMREFVAHGYGPTPTTVSVAHLSVVGWGERGSILGGIPQSLEVGQGFAVPAEEVRLFRWTTGGHRTVIKQDGFGFGRGSYVLVRKG